MLNLINKVIKITPPIIKKIASCLLVLASLYFLFFKFDRTVLTCFWNNNWEKILTSIGSIATAGTLILAVYDLRKKYAYEKKKFEFESDPVMKVLPIPYGHMDMQDYILAVYGYISNNPKFHLISRSENKFFMKNSGKGIADNVNITVSNSQDFIEENCIKCFENTFTSGEQLVFSINNLLPPQNDIIDWTQDLYIKYEGENRYNKNKFTYNYKANVRELDVILPTPQIGGLFNTKNGFTREITKEYTKNKSEYYIHNITSM